MITKCTHCNKTIKVKQKKNRNGSLRKNFFCDLSCYETYRADKKWTIKTCLYCHKEFRYRSKQKDRSCCSLSCASRYGLMITKRKTGKMKECGICKKGFWVAPNRKKEGRGKYCSIMCRGVALSKIMTGKIRKKLRNGKYVSCFNCKKKFYVKPFLTSGSRKRKFCSFGCFRVGSKPTSIEISTKKYLNKHFPNEWKYVGNGEVWIGRKNPDFINTNGQKKLIEVFGDYWHKKSEEKERIQHFEKYGFKTLVIWEHEIKQNNYENKLFSFIKE